MPKRFWFFLYLAKLRKLLLKYIETQENGAVMWSEKDWLISIDKDVNKLDPKNSDEMDFICSW